MAVNTPAVHRSPPIVRRPWPTPQDYNEAVQNPALNFFDAELRGGRPELTPLGLPRAITGGFASVYRLDCGQWHANTTRSWAVRCFLREVPDQQERYAAIGRHLATVTLPATVDFAYQADGIRVGGRPYPILKMAWLGGEPLDRWIERHLGDPAALRALSDRWVALLRDLRRANVAHGDLQHGNILVVGDELRLIDYDGLYVPDLAGRAATEVGHRNYQHPRRGAADFGPHLDHFAAWSILLSLRALAVDPSLWQRLGAGDEALLLRREDYERPAASVALAALAALPDPACQGLVARFRALLDQPVAQLPPLDGTEQPRPVTRRAPVVRALPRPAPTQASGAASWLADHLPAPPVRRLALAPLRDRVGLGAASLLLFAFAALGLAGFVALATTLATTLAICAIIALGLAARFLTLPTTPALLAAHWRVRRCALRVAWWARLLVLLVRWSARIAAREVSQLAALDTTRQEQAQALQGERAALRRALARHEAMRQQLDQDEADALAQSLLDHRQRATAAKLAPHTLLDANLPGLGSQATLRLLQANIRTAADFSDLRVLRGTSTGAGETIQLATPDRGWVQIDGIGRRRAQALLDWRRDLLAQHGLTPPASLSPAQTASIAHHYAKQRAILDRRAATAARHAAQQETLLRERAKDERAELPLRATEIRDRAAHAQRRTATLTHTAQAHLAAAQLAHTLAQRELAAHRRVGFVNYLRVVLGLDERYIP